MEDTQVSRNSGPKQCPELRKEQIHAAKSLWGALLEAESTFSDMLTADALLTTEELEAFFAGRDKSATMSEMLSDYRELKTVTAKMSNLRKLASHRLFSGEPLWDCFQAASRSLGRAGWLVHQSLEKKAYQDWRIDSGIDQLIRPVLTAAEIEKGKQKQLGGFSYLFGCLRERAFREAVQVTEGLHDVERP